MAYDIMVLGQTLSERGKQVIKLFTADHVASWDAAVGQLSRKHYRAIVWDSIALDSVGWTELEAFMLNNPLTRAPIILLAPVSQEGDRLKAFDMGCDDYIEAHATADEIAARINRAIYNQIANDQLSSRLRQQIETAPGERADNSDLAANIQFLLQVHGCDNLDQLGQQFFATVRRYGLLCSLQMRGVMGVKNMEVNGMAKDLESQLLLQLKDRGRYVDFGRRTVINYDRVSLLIKNMPDDEAERCSIKGNILCLVEGINSRVLAIEDRCRLLAEKEALKKLSVDVHVTVSALQRTYQQVMKAIVMEVENASERIQNRLPHLALTEQDESFMEHIAEDVVVQTNRIFHDGLRVNELFVELETAVERSLNQVDTAERVAGAAGCNPAPGLG